MPAFIIGIGGGSGSGKSAVADELRRRLAPFRVKIMNQDRYFHDSARLPSHTSRDGARTWPDHNHPQSFDCARLRAEVRRARDTETDVIILEGILVLQDPELRELMDLKLFVEADPDERIIRRIQRNLARGGRLDEICGFYLDSVRYRHQEFCAPTRAFADLVVPGGRDDRAQAQPLLSEVCARVRAHLSGRARAAAPESAAT